MNSKGTVAHTGQRAQPEHPPKKISDECSVSSYSMFNYHSFDFTSPDFNCYLLPIWSMIDT